MKHHKPHTISDPVYELWVDGKHIPEHDTRDWLTALQTARYLARTAAIGAEVRQQPGKRVEYALDAVYYPAPVDRTEYCVDCRKYHDRPVWPAAHRSR